MNMVIHDMRNPSNAAEFGMQESLKLIDEALREYRQFKQQLQKNAKNQVKKKIKIPKDDDS